ncbi:hypothetical protein B0J14DRAFT_326834 [Halenospora varia]|nr:hypothetical protein B0J14DRAFT_326834 [Halenospora varia]
MCMCQSDVDEKKSQRKMPEVGERSSYGRSRETAARKPPVLTNESQADARGLADYARRQPEVNWRECWRSLGEGGQGLEGGFGRGVRWTVVCWRKASRPRSSLSQPRFSVIIVCFVYIKNLFPNKFPCPLCVILQIPISLSFLTISPGALRPARCPSNFRLLVRRSCTAKLDEMRSRRLEMLATRAGDKMLPDYRTRALEFTVSMFQWFRQLKCCPREQDTSILLTGSPPTKSSEVLRNTATRPGHRNLSCRPQRCLKQHPILR